ncbi:MAG: lycopene cyclase domain-containing protein [Candidatus Diapherotrites archaeon]|nr:lycopene cyclase domain-containing protein [Candidatus Diapherotrites archaeon]MDZ4256722.1 lycopene cyclase domain-containing protein [archaeon]
MEYTIWVSLALFGVWMLDLILETKVIRPTRRLVFTTGIFLVFQLVFDNLFTSQGIWRFNPNAVLGIYLPIIPLENLLFGTALLWSTLILYTQFQKMQYDPHPPKEAPATFPDQTVFPFPKKSIVSRTTENHFRGNT